MRECGHIAKTYGKSLILASSGPAVGPLVAVLGCLGGLFVRLDAILGRLGAILGRLGVFLGRLSGLGGLPRPC